MFVINDGKFSILIFRILKYKLELQFFITRDCSTSLRDKGLLKITIWKNAEIFYYKGIEIIKLRYKY